VLETLSNNCRKIIDASATAEPWTGDPFTSFRRRAH
jgi:hypothetical protein